MFLSLSVCLSEWILNNSFGKLKIKLKTLTDFSELSKWTWTHLGALYDDIQRQGLQSKKFYVMHT